MEKFYSLFLSINRIKIIKKVNNKYRKNSKFEPVENYHKKIKRFLILQTLVNCSIHKCIGIFIDK